MPRRKSYTTAEGFQSLDQHLIAQQMIPLRVEEKQGDWDAETKTNAQKTNADGVPQWLIQTLFQPIDGDTEHAPEVVPVTVTAKVKPVIRVGFRWNLLDSAHGFTSPTTRLRSRSRRWDAASWPPGSNRTAVNDDGA